MFCFSIKWQTRLSSFFEVLYKEKKDGVTLHFYVCGCVLLGNYLSQHAALTLTRTQH